MTLWRGAWQSFYVVRRVFAAVAAVWLVCCGVLAMQHEASVAHVRDPHTGELRHAQSLVGDHTIDQSDIHGAPSRHAETDECSISATFHQAAQPAPARPIVVAPRAAALVELAPAAPALHRATGYRIAPKTSPPEA